MRGMAYVEGRVRVTVRTASRFHTRGLVPASDVITSAGKWCDSLGSGISSRWVIEEAHQDLRMALPSTQIAVQLSTEFTR